MTQSTATYNLDLSAALQYSHPQLQPTQQQLLLPHMLTRGKKKVGSFLKTESPYRLFHALFLPRYTLLFFKTIEKINLLLLVAFTITV